METQRLQKEKWSEVHLPLLFIYMIQGQWGQLEKGPKCLVLINHGSTHAQLFMFNSNVIIQVLIWCQTFWGVGGCKSLFVLLHRRCWANIGSPLPDLFLGSSDHFSISCFHLVLCVKGIRRRARSQHCVCQWGAGELREKEGGGARGTDHPIVHSVTMLPMARNGTR